MRHGRVNLLNRGTTFVWIQVSDTNEFCMRRVNITAEKREPAKMVGVCVRRPVEEKCMLILYNIYSRHFARIVKRLVPATDQPTIFVHAHDVFIVAINNVFHGKLVAELVRIRIARRGIDRKAQSDKG